MLWVIILGAIFLIPFFSPDVNRAGSHFLYGALAIFLLVFALWKKKWLKERSILFPLLIWLIVLLVTSLFAILPMVAMSQALYFLLYALVFVIIADLEAKRKRQIAVVLIAGSFFVSLRAVLQHFFYFNELIPYITAERPPVTGRELGFIINMAERQRAISFFPIPNILASYLAMINLLIVGVIFGMLRDGSKNKRAFIVLAVLLILNSYSLWLTRSIAGIAGFVFGLFLFLLFYFVKDKRRLKSASRFFVLFGIAMAVLLVLLISRRFSHESRADNLIYSLQGRLQFWKTALRIIAERPFSFAGLGNFGYLYFIHAVPGGVKSSMAHNLILQLWIETGPYGLLIFFWFLSSLLMRTIRITLRREEAASGVTITALQAGALSAICAFLFHNMAGFSFFMPQTALICWIILALVFDQRFRNFNPQSF